MADTAETGAPQAAPAPPALPPAPGPRSTHVMSRGMKFPKDGRFITGRVRGALRSDSYERKESDAALRLVQPGDVVLELGAGIGYMSTLLSRKCGAARVHSFEANPELIPYIERVHAANCVRNAHVTNAILGSRAGHVDFHVQGNFLSSSLRPEAGAEVLRVERIAVLDANAVIRELRPTVLVVDIEGGEAELFTEIDLSGLRAAMVELHPQWIGQAGVQVVFDAMQRAGLTYWPRASEHKVVCFRKGW